MVIVEKLVSMVKAMMLMNIFMITHPRNGTTASPHETQVENNPNAVIHLSSNKLTDNQRQCSAQPLWQHTKYVQEEASGIGIK